MFDYKKLYEILLDRRNDRLGYMIDYEDLANDLLDDTCDEIGDLKTIEFLKSCGYSKEDLCKELKFSEPDVDMIYAMEE